MSVRKNFEAAFDRIRTLEAELNQAKADREVLAAALDRAIEHPSDVTDERVIAARQRAGGK